MINPENARSIAMADFMFSPDIAEVDSTDYHGHNGNTIRMQVFDDFRIKQAMGATYNSDGSQVEQGEAIRRENLNDWIDTAATENTEAKVGFFTFLSPAKKLCNREYYS